MNKFSFKESNKKVRWTSLKRKRIVFECETEEKVFSVSISRYGKSDVTDTAKRPPELFELRICSRKNVRWFLRPFNVWKKKSSIFNNPYELIREILNSSEFPSACVKDMLIPRIRKTYNIPKPAPKTAPVQPGAKGSGGATTPTGGAATGQTQTVV